MMLPARIAVATLPTVSCYNIARVWGIQDYAVVTTLCRLAFDARWRYTGMEHFHFDTFFKAGIGMDKDSKFIRLSLTQYCGIDGWRFVTPTEALQYLMSDIEREGIWLAGISTVLKNWGSL